ncbi:MAG: hypothetical protein JSS02_19895 [Planctomycetes bacterium]|nr:hypothetical protein [Planctomycetota bacterium]
MSDPLQQYSNAVLAYTASVHQARRVAEIVNRGATALRNWEHVQVTGILGEFPEEVRRRHASENDVCGDDWPGAQQIANVLLAYHQAKQALELAFSEIPEALRHAVKNPESVAPPR